MAARFLRRLLPLSVLRARGAYTPAGTPMPERYRRDGVRITHDPYAPGMAEKYGAPGQTDSEGFDPYADTVGPGIYGGRVQRDERGGVTIGKQYQNHNPRPGPIYAGGGYTPMTEGLKDPKRLRDLLDKYPDLVNDESTGGAMPLHMCGMSQAGQVATWELVRRGGDIEALDTYGFTPLHRMASNNLAEGALALLTAGADPTAKGGCGQTPAAVARGSAASAVMQVLQQFPERIEVPIVGVTVMNAGVDAVNGRYEARQGSDIPEKFALVCEQNGWDTQSTWRRLAGVGGAGERGGAIVWFEAPNKSYIYFNAADGHWWLDGPDGLGVYKARGLPGVVPAYPRGCGGPMGWFPMDEQSAPVPSFLVHRALDASYGP